MAVKIAKDNNTFNTAATWAVVDATSLLDSEAGNTEIGTSYTPSSNFTPGAIEIDGIAVKLASRAASGAYTMSVQLYNATDGAAVAGTEVTINLTDLPTCSVAQNEGGWAFFKFASPVTLIAGKAYNVQTKESNAAADIYLFRDGTANNWSRMLRTTTTGAPAAADILHIMGEWTGAGAQTTRTVTMDQVAASVVDIGSGTDNTVALTISKGGTLNYGYSAATAYYLKCSGNLIGYNGGTMAKGTVANPIPSDSSAILEFDPVADGGMGLVIRNGFTFTDQGYNKTTHATLLTASVGGYCNTVGTAVTRVNGQTFVGMTGTINIGGTNYTISSVADADHLTLTGSAGTRTFAIYKHSATANVLTVGATAGWAVNDVIAIASTSRTYSECESATIQSVDSGTQVTLTAPLTYQHDGISPTQAEVINLTRNSKIRSASSTVMSYVSIKPTATVDVDWVEFSYLKVGYIETTSGNFSIKYSSISGSEDDALKTIYSSACNNIEISYNVTWNNTGGIYVGDTSAGGNIIIDNNIFMYSNGTGNIILFNDAAITFTNNTVAGANGGSSNSVVRFNDNVSPLGTFSGNKVHSCAQKGIYVSAIYPGSIIGSFTVYRCNSYGLYFYLGISNVKFLNFTLFGNSNANIFFGNYSKYGNIIFDNLVCDSETGYTTTNGINDEGPSLLCDIKILNSSFSNGGGNKIAHTNDINISSNTYATIYLNKVKLGATNEVITNANWINGSFVKSTMHDQLTGANLKHKSWFKYGIIESDTAVYNTASPSMKMTPNNATNVLESGSFKVNVNSGQTCTPIVYVRQSEAAEGDSADFNGASKPRLILKRNDAIGITADVVLDTATNAIGSPWEALTGTTAAATEDGVMEFVVDCLGTTGFVNVDDFSASVA